MSDSNLPGTDLLKTVLEPLLGDFDYWFGRWLRPPQASRQLLETEKLKFMSDEEQSNLLMRVNQAQAELNTAKMLFTATDGKVGIEMATLKPWHLLVAECWNVSRRFREEQGI